MGYGFADGGGAAGAVNADPGPAFAGEGAGLGVQDKEPGSVNPRLALLSGFRTDITTFDGSVDGSNIEMAFRGGKVANTGFVLLIPASSYGIGLQQRPFIQMVVFGLLMMM